MPASPDAAPGGLPSRRSVLVAGAFAVAGIAATGCSVTSSAEPSPRPTVTPSPDADVALATQALTAIDETLALAESTRAHGAARAGVASLVALHREHVKALVDAVPSDAHTSGSSRGTAPGPVSRLVRREQQLHVQLDDLAVRAQSGPFARLLASMGTAVSLRLAELA